MDSSKLEEFADNFQFDKNGREVGKQVENTAGEGESCMLRATSPFPAVFSKDFVLQTRKNQGLFGKVLTIYHTIQTFNDLEEIGAF